MYLKSFRGPSAIVKLLLLPLSTEVESTERREHINTETEKYVHLEQLRRAKDFREKEKWLFTLT